MNLQKNKRESADFSATGDYFFGDKDIAVQIRSNSHYRNSVSGQVGMLIGSCLIKVSWAIRGDTG